MRKNIPWNARTEAKTEETLTDRAWDNIALRRGEEVVEEYRASALWPTIGSSLGFAVPFLIWPGIWTFLGWLAFTVSWRWGEHENRWAITNQRILQRTGVGAKKATSIDLTRVTDVSVERPYFNPILRRGKVRVNSAGRSDDEIIMFGMADPDAVAGAISR